VDVDLLGRCGVRRNLWLQVWYLICSYLGVVFYAVLVSLTSSSYPSPCSPLFFGTIALGGGFFWSASRVLLYNKTLEADQKKTPPPRAIVPKNKGEQGDG